jgi:hypothetical protein
MKENDVKKQVEWLEVSCFANGGTDFTKPLQEVLDFVNSSLVKELYVLFLTDGCDGNRDRTIKLSETLKNVLYQKNIYSWFNVIGLGEGHDAAFLGLLADIGTERGQFEYMTNQEISNRDLTKLTAFYEKSLFK